MKLVRTRQHPVMWGIDVVLTLAAWAGLIWLMMRGIASMLDSHGDPRLQAPIFAALNTLQIYLWIALFNAVSLISCSRYQQRSESFKLEEGALEQLRRPGVVVIHNDEHGDVEDVKSHVSRDVERPPLTLVPGQEKGKDAG